MDFSDLIQWCLEHLSYWVILILMILENSLVPLPSELIVTPAAYKAANGEMNISLVILFTTLGALIGALINYHLALFVGRPIVYKFADSRFRPSARHKPTKDRVCGSIFPETRQDIDLLRKINTGRAAVHFHPCRTGTNAASRLHPVHNTRFGHLEQYPWFCSDITLNRYFLKTGYWKSWKDTAGK